MLVWAYRESIQGAFSGWMCNPCLWMAASIGEPCAMGPFLFALCAALHRKAASWKGQQPWPRLPLMGSSGSWPRPWICARCVVWLGRFPRRCFLLLDAMLVFILGSCARWDGVCSWYVLVSMGSTSVSSEGGSGFPYYPLLTSGFGHCPVENVPSKVSVPPLILRCSSLLSLPPNLSSIPILPSDPSPTRHSPPSSSRTGWRRGEPSFLPVLLPF